MTIGKWILRGVLLSVLCFSATDALHAQGCEGMPYLHQNRFDQKPLELQDLHGIAVDQNGNVIAQVCVGLFSEPDHQLLRYAQSDNKGAFTVDTKGLPDGQYRFVGQLVGFCPANAVVNINHSQKKKPLEVHMNLPGTTTCSYVKVKKQ